MCDLWQRGRALLSRAWSRAQPRASSGPERLRFDAALGYVLLGGAGDATLAFTETFAAGAVLTMLADTMAPEAVEHAGAAVGLACVSGFVCSFLLSMAGGV